MRARKAIVRSIRGVGILMVEQAVLAMDMVDDCNLTVHTYNVENNQLRSFLRLVKKSGKGLYARKFL